MRLELSLDLSNISYIHKNYINIAHVISPVSPYNVRRNNAAQLPKACDTIEMWIFVHESVSFLVFITFQGDTPVRMLMQTMFLDFMVIINGGTDYHNGSYIQRTRKVLWDPTCSKGVCSGNTGEHPSWTSSCPFWKN